MTKPMTAYTGYVTFTDFVAGTEKGGVQVNDLFNGAYGLGQMTNARMDYTSARVVEEFKAGDTIKFAWAPVRKFEVVDAAEQPTWYINNDGEAFTDEEMTTAATADADIKVKYVYKRNCTQRV